MESKEKGLLQEELRTYEENRDRLLAEYEGKFVLIYGGEILGTFDSQNDAVSEGYRELGNVPFLVKRITDVETPLNYTSNLLAV